jgi:hypothetical protein
MTTVTTRATKGSPLTWDELDTNFNDLAAAVDGKQDSSSKLADIAALAVADGNIIVGDGSTWVAESGATARISLGLAIGTDVQAYNEELAALSGLTSAANKVPMFSGSGTATVLDFKDEDNMASDSATALPSQQSVKAYADAITSAMPTQRVVAWVNFNGTGTPAVRASHNVSSITDHGAWQYTINFTTPLADANYAVSLTCGDTGAIRGVNGPYSDAPTASAFRIITVDAANNPVDVEYISAVFFR